MYSTWTVSIRDIVSMADCRPPDAGTPAAWAPLPIKVTLAASADTVASLDIKLRMTVLHLLAALLTSAQSISYAIRTVKEVNFYRSIIDKYLLYSFANSVINEYPFIWT
jgi:hypothetical protein